MTTRSYCIGLPVVITVHDDGRVTAEVDLSEADDLFEGAPTDDQGVALYSDADIEDDIEFVRDAFELGKIERI